MYGFSFSYVVIYRCVALRFGCLDILKICGNVLDQSASIIYLYNLQYSFFSETKVGLFQIMVICLAGRIMQAVYDWLNGIILGPLTLKFDRATEHFLRFNR